MNRFGDHRRRRAAVVAGTILATAIAATAATGASGGSSASPGVAYAQKQIALFKRVPQFAAPGAPFDARAATKGKTIWSIPSTSAVPFVANIQRFEKKIASQVGVSFTTWPNQGQPAQWVQGVQQAIARGASVIDLLAGINPAAVQAQIQAALKKKIPVSVSHLYDPRQASPVKGIARVDIHYEQAGRLLADWAIWKTNGNAHALVVTVNEVPSTDPMVHGIKDEFAKHCGSGCSLKFTNVTIAEAAQRIQPQTQTALVADPKINYVLALYDSVEVPSVVAAIRAAHADDRVKVATFNGTPSIFKMIKDGDIVQMDVGEDINWIAHAVLDQDMRLAAGLKPVSDPKVGIRVIDDSNVGQTGNPPKDAKGYGSSYVAGYAKLWKLNG